MPDAAGGAGEHSLSTGSALLEPVEASVLPRASRDRVDVGWFGLRGGPGRLEAARRCLGPGELERAARLRHGAEGWVMARWALRRVLAGQLGLDPSRVPLVTDTNGKPRLAPGAGADLRFNLSHSGDVALVALRVGHEVGADVERIRDDVDFEGAARAALPSFALRRFRAPGESARAALREAFFRAWTRHEARAKAGGWGIASRPGRSGLDALRVRELAAPPGYAAAVASEGDAWTVALHLAR